MNKLKVLDLFSGIGGFSLGLERTGGFETVAFCEIDEAARKVLRKHWPKVQILEDVKKINKPHDSALMSSNIDVICGGFPCQDISTANTTGKGLKGERSGLWREFKRLIQEVKPRYAIIENVANLRSKGLPQVIKDLWKIGYDCEWHIIPACSVGAYHKRERIWIIAYPNSESVRKQQQRKPKRRLQERVQDQGQAKPGNNGNERDASNTSSKRAQGCNESGSNGEGLQQEKRSESISENTLRSDDQQLQSTYANNFRLWKPFASEEERRKWWAKTSSSVSDVYGKIHEVEPTVHRGNDGFSDKLDERRRKERVKQLGNAVVPQIPQIIGQTILDYEARHANN